MLERLLTTGLIVGVGGNMVSLLDYVNDLEDLIKVKTLNSSDLYNGFYTAYHKGGELTYSWNDTNDGDNPDLIPDGEYVSLESFSVYPYSLVQDESFVYILMDIMRAFVGRYPEFDFYLQTRYDLDSEDVYIRVVFPLFGRNSHLVPGGPYGCVLSGFVVKGKYFPIVEDFINA